MKHRAPQSTVRQDRSLTGPSGLSEFGHRFLLAAAADLRVLRTRSRFAGARYSMIAAVVVALGVAAGCGGDAGPRVAAGTPLHGGSGGGVTAAPVAPASTAPASVNPSAANVHAGGVFASNPAVTPVGTLVTPDVFVHTTNSITPAQLAAVEAKTGAKQILVVSVGPATIATGTTLAVGVDASTFRNWTPSVDADNDGLWERIAAGDAAVAHTIFNAQALTLGGNTTIGHDASSAWQFRVGAEATTGIPGIGIVVSHQYDQLLQLKADTGLLISAPQSDPVLTASNAYSALAGDTVSTAQASLAGGAASGDGIVSTPMRLATDASTKWYLPAVGPLTQPFRFGATATNFGHPGIDIGSTYGRPIYAAAAGTVTYAGPAEGYGNEVLLTHAGGVQTLYGHMEAILVKPGQTVVGGEKIALVGSEGDSTGPHLHFEVHLPDSTGGTSLTDPLAWLNEHGVQLDPTRD